MRFQIHLSTAIMLMFVAGLLLWANLRHRTESVVLEWQRLPVEETSETLFGDPIYDLFGWPYNAASQLIGTKLPTKHVILRSADVLKYSIPNQLHFEKSKVALNASVGLLICIFVWQVSEVWIMRRRRK